MGRSHCPGRYGALWSAGASISLTLSALRRLTVRSAIVVITAACGEESTESSLSPGTARASLGVSASVQAATATAVEVHAGYARAGSTVDLAQKTVSLTTAADQDITLSLDLGPCLRATGRSSCPVIVSFVLLRGSTVLDTQQSVPVAVAPGVPAKMSQSVMLYEVQSVRVTAAGGSSSVVQGQSAAMSALAFDRTGGVLAGRVMQWESSNTAVLRVDPATGTATGVAAGTAAVRAKTGGRTGELPLTVTVNGARVLTLTPASVQLAVGTSQPLTAQARDASGSLVSGIAISFSSSNTGVALVTDGGVVTGVAAGNAIVTARATEPATGVALTAQTSVSVTAPQLGIVLSSSAVQFTAQQAAAVGALTVAVTNSGPGVLTGLQVNAVTYDAGAANWLRATLSGTSTPATLTLQPSTTSLAPGHYVARVPVAAPAPNSPQVVTVTFDVTQPQTTNATYGASGPVPGLGGGVTWQMTIAGSSVSGSIHITSTDVTFTDLVLSGTASGSNITFSGTHQISDGSTRCELRMVGTGIATATQLTLSYRWGYTGAGSGPDVDVCAEAARDPVGGFNNSPLYTDILPRIR